MRFKRATSKGTSQVADTPIETARTVVPSAQKEDKRAASPMLGGLKRMTRAAIRQANAWPTTLGIAVPGTGKTFERPKRDGLEGWSPTDIPDCDVDPVIAECEAIATHARTILQRTVAPSHGLKDRPGGAKGLEKLVACLPWLSPRPLGAMATMAPEPLSDQAHAKLISELDLRSKAHRAALDALSTAERALADAKAGLRTNEFASVMAHTDSLSDRLTTLNSEIARVRQILDQAKATRDSSGSFTPERFAATDTVNKQESLIQQLETQRDSLLREIDTQKTASRPANDGVAEASARVERRRRELVGADGVLRAALCVAELHDVGGAVLTADVASQHLEFVHSQLDKFGARIAEHQRKAESDLDVGIRILDDITQTRAQVVEGIGTLESDKAVQMDQVARLNHDLLQVRMTLEASQARANLLRQSIPALQDNVSAARGPVPMMGEDPGWLAVQYAENALARARAELDDIEEAIPALQTFAVDTALALDDAKLRLDAAEEQRSKLLDRVEEIDAQMFGLQAVIDAAGKQVQAANEASQAMCSPSDGVIAKRYESGDALKLAKADFEKHQSVLIDALIQRPPLFPELSATPALSAELKKMIETWLDNPNADALPKLAALEIICHALSLVTEADAKRATELLAMMRSRPTLDWIAKTRISTEVSPFSSQEIPVDVKALFRMMAPIPRGAELLQMMGANEGALMNSLQLAALRIFWQADGAAEAENDPAVRAWLESAKAVASLRLHWDSSEHADETLDTHLANKLDERHLGAYNAVRNGFLSNAPGSDYDQHNQRFKKMTEEWLVRADDRFATGCLAGLLPTRSKTPFKSSVVKRASKLGERFGLTTHRTLADRIVKDAVTNFRSMVDAVRQASANLSSMPADREFNLAVSLLAKYLDDSDVTHLCEHQLTKKDFDAIRESMRQTVGGASHRRGLSKIFGKAPARQLLPEPLETLAAEAFAAGKTMSRASGVSVIETLRTVMAEFSARNAQQLTADQKALLDNDMGMNRVHELLERAHLTRFEDKDDVVKFFEPMLSEWGLRDKIKMSAGGAVGAGIPFLPYAPPGISALISGSAGMQRKDEAFIQFFQPLLGFELMVGESKMTAAEGALGAGKMWEAGGVKMGTTGAIKGVSQHTKMDGSLVRFVRSRHQDDIQRKNMKTALESIVLWDRLQPKNGTGAYSGPVEALLSRSPDAVLTRFDAGVKTKSVEGRLAGAFKFGKRTGHGTKMGIGASASILAKAERGFEYRSEAAAATYVNADKTSTGKQTFSVSADAQVPLPENARSAPIGGRTAPHGTFSGGSVPGLFSVKLDLAQHLEKHGLSPFRINNKQDGDIDRHYFTPKEMLAEIEENREQWIARGVQTLPAVEGRTDTLHNRIEAERLLDRFVAEIKHFGATSNFCQYNINYSMRPQASAWIDSLNALGALAELRNDVQTQREAATAIDEVLSRDSTFRPLMLIVRERGKEASEYGVNYGLRAQITSQVETQRTAAQYPPP